MTLGNMSVFIGGKKYGIMNKKKWINIELVDILNPPDPIVLDDDSYDDQLRACGCKDCLEELELAEYYDNNG